VNIFKKKTEIWQSFLAKTGILQHNIFFILHFGKMLDEKKIWFQGSFTFILGLLCDTN
jgi:hypothetical protein